MTSNVRGKHETGMTKLNIEQLNKYSQTSLARTPLGP